MAGVDHAPRTDPAETDDGPGTGGPRSAGTRRAILDAARTTFADRGYEQTTIRVVAAQAGIDPSMVMRYFRSKAGLFTAAATANLDPPDLRPVPVRRRGEVLVRHFVDRWEESLSDDALVFLLRTAVTNEAVTEQLQATFNRLVVEPVSALGLDHAEQRGALIGTQLLGLALCRYLLHLQPLASLTAAEVVDSITPSVQRHLTTRST